MDVLAAVATAAIIPTLYLMAAIWPTTKDSDRTPIVRFVAWTTLGFAMIHTVVSALATQAAPSSIRVDPITSILLLLTTFLAAIISRYAANYLAGEPGQDRFARWLAIALAAVTTLVVSNHLLVIMAAWTVTSICLHQLLLYYRNRREAELAAHKTFLASRLADACFVAALVLIWLSVGTFNLDALNAIVLTSVPTELKWAAFLLANGALLRTSQLPFHGWLTQVMEAPTPVSALLHAGIVNLSGIVLIRLATFMSAVPIAQLLLVAVGTATAVTAALIMITRTTIKVRLAWSTIGQMGFMMLQCGLGAYELALLHLVAHSLYKAHAFLSSGSAVETWRIQQYTAPEAAPSKGLWTLGVLVAIVAGVGLLAWTITTVEPKDLPFLALLIFALSPSLAQAVSAPRERLGSTLIPSLGVVALYLAWHELVYLANLGVPALHPTLADAWLLPRLGIVLLGLVLLFGIQVLLLTAPRSGFSRYLRPQLYAGFYLDERFTKLAFRVWPPRPLQHANPAQGAYQTPKEVDA